MANNFCVNLTRSTDDPDRATVALVVANAAVASGKNTMIFLSSEGSRLAVKGTAEKINEEGFQPMTTLLQNFLAAGGLLWVCSPCFKKRGYTDSDLIEGATIVGGAKLVEFLSNDAASVSY
jgi:predicted peroxiredoxin